jgi:4-hydroxy-2-oxoglutarate aldolase
MRLSGIIPPVVTPFLATGELDIASLQKLLQTLGPSVSGFLLLGTNSEVAYLSEVERSRVIQAGREVIKDKPLVVGTGAESTHMTISRTQEAAKLGADAVLVLAPFYHRPSMTPDVLERHFKAVADSSPVPVYIYNMPQVTGITHSSDWLAKMGQHPNVAGLKDSSGDVMTLTETCRLAPPTFNVLTGNAPTLLSALTIGAHGGILAAANVIPELLAELVRRYENQDMKGSLELQRRVNPLAYAVTRDYGVSGLKAAARLRGYSAGYPRAPLAEVSDNAMKHLEALLENLLMVAA